MNGTVREEYFNIPYYSLEENEVFVDGGMYDGKTTQRFVELCPTYGRVYGYEANAEQVKIIQDNLKQFERVTIFEKALYSKSDKLYIKLMGEGSCLDDDGTMEVAAVSIDECNINPTYIKLDIEGPSMRHCRV